MTTGFCFILNISSFRRSIIFPPLNILSGFLATQTSADMHFTGTTALKRVLNVLVPIHCASISSFQDLDDERIEKNNSRDYLREQ